MNKIIKGKQYNTETAKELANWTNRCGDGDLNFVEETLYTKSTGEYFLHGAGGAASRYAESAGQNSWTGGERILPLSLDAARQWAEEHLPGDGYEAIFGIPEEGESIAKLISLPIDVVALLDQERSDSGRTYGEIIADLVRPHDVD